MPRKRNLSTEEQVLSVLWTASRSSEQLAKNLGVSLSAINESCGSLSELRMVRHENGLWRLHYRDGIAKKTVELGDGTLAKVLSAYERKSRNKAFIYSHKTYSGKRGSKVEWTAGARMLVGREDEHHKYLEILRLSAIPTMKQLNSAWKARLKEAHPDVGGSHQDAALINEAHEKLRKLID